MNKGRYTLVYSDAQGTYMPAPEETSRRGKGRGSRALRRLVAAMAAAMPGLVIANPSGHQVIQGPVEVQQQGNTLNITAGDKSIIHWKHFSIQAGEVTRFIQPDANSSVLNRVVGQDPSHILGSLIANGKVFLINPNGILFGAGARVDTAGLVASTLNISNQDFASGRLRFTAEGAAGKLRNEGTLKTTGGPLLLIATDIENTGLITADNGDIVLAAGKSVDIADPHQPALRVRIEAGGEAVNLGQIIARSGNAGMFGAALVQGGKVQATGAERTADGRIVLKASKSVTLTAQSETTARTSQGDGGQVDIAAPEVKVEAGAVIDTSGMRGGRIDIAAEHRAVVEGTLRSVGRLPAPAPAPAPAAPADIELPATAAGPLSPGTPPVDAGQGGHIVVTGETVRIGAEAELDASGDRGGGSLLIGGDWQGANPAVRNAQTTQVASGARLLVDALQEGDGGKVVVWGDQVTAFHGNIWARGGRDGGNGGQVEVSGKVALLYRGRTDTSAARGRNGTLLLDPLAIVIQGGSGDGSIDGNASFGDDGRIDAGALGPTVLFESEIEEQSKTTDIVLRAQRSVTVGDQAFSYTGSGNASGETSGQLTLAADSSLLIETRNLGTAEGGASAGIDLVTGGAHGAALRIVTQGSGSMTLQTGYSNGVQVGDQRADIVLPVLQTAAGGILIRAGSSSTVDLRGSRYDSGAGIDIDAGTVTGGVTFNASDGTHIDGDYSATSGTLTFNGGASSISGRLTLAANLGGNAALTLGGLLWQSGQMLSGATTTLTGSGLIDNSVAYRYLDRRLNVTGQLELANSAGYDLYVRDGGQLNISAGGSVGTAAADGFLRLAASSGTALFSAEGSASLALGDGSTFNLSSDNAAGNLIAGSFTTTGNGLLLLAAGRINTGADTTISGSGSLRLANSGAIGGSHVLTVATLFDWRGGSMDGSGSTVLSGNGLIDDSSAYRYLQRTLRIDGTLTLDNPTGYDLRIGNGGHLHIGSTGTLATGTTNGFIYMQAGTGGTTTLSADAGGRIAVADGTMLTLRSDSNSGNQLAGSFDLDGSGVLHLDSGAIHVDGNATFGGDGLLRMSGGATINGGGTLTIASGFDWRGGRFGGSGTTRLIGDAVIDNTSAYKYASRRIEVSGHLTFGNSAGYDLRIENGGALHLAAGGRLSTASNGLIYMQAGSGGSAAFSAAAGSAITVGEGTTLTLRGDGNAGNTLGGQFVLDGAGALHIDSGLFTTAAPTTVGGTGLLRISGGTTLNFDHASTISTQFRFEGGTLGGSGNVLINGPMIWSGGTLSGSGTATLAGNAVIDNTAAYKLLNRRMVVTGSMQFGNSSGYYLQIGAGGTLHIAASGRLSTDAAAGMIYMAAGSAGSALFSADEGARIDAASGADLTLQADSSGNNFIGGHFTLGGTGDVHLDSGLMRTSASTVIDGSGRLRISSGATLEAAAALTLAGPVRMDGGTLGGSADIVLSGDFSWGGGTMAGSGTTTLTGHGHVDGSSAYRYLDRRMVVGGELLFSNSTGYFLQIRQNGGDSGALHIATGGRLLTDGANGYIHMASGSGGSVLLSADAGSVISLGSGTTLRLQSDSNAGNRIAGQFTLEGDGRMHLDSGVISADADTTFAGDGILQLSSGATLAGSGLVNIASRFEWLGGSMAGSGTTRLLRDSALSGSGARYVDRRFEVAQGVTLSLGDNVSLQRSTSNGGSGALIASGEVVKDSGSGTAYLQYLDLSGTIASSSGTLSLHGNTQGSSLHGLRAATRDSGLLRLDSGLFTLGDGQQLAITAGRLDLSGATLASSGSATVQGTGQFRIESGTLGGAGTLTVSAGFDWTGGSMSGTGTTRLDTSATLTGSGTRTLDRTLEVAAGRTLTLGENVAIQRSTSNGGSGTLVALGNVERSGDGTAYLRYLDLRGNVTATSGILSLVGNTAGSRIGGAVLTTSGSGSLRLDSGSFVLDANDTLQIAAGSLELSGATLTTSGNSSIAGAGRLRFTSGSITGSGVLDIRTDMDWSGGSMAGAGTTRLSGATRILSGSLRALSRTLEIAGTTLAQNTSGALQIQTGGRLAILSAGELELAGAPQITHEGSGRMDNAGLLRKTGSATATLAMPLTNTGTLKVESGTLITSQFPLNAGLIDVTAGATLQTGAAALNNTGIVQGGGTLNLGGALFSNAGTVRPGGQGSAGTLTLIAQFEQTAEGVLEADVLGTAAADQDKLVVSGSAEMGGALVMLPADDVKFGANDRYTVLSCGSDGCLSGRFARIDTGALQLSANTFSNALSFATGTIASNWISESSGYWDVAANWAGGLIPTDGNEVIIDRAGDLTITIRSSTRYSEIRLASLFSNENIEVTGSTLTLSRDSVINGRLVMSGGTINIGSELRTGGFALSGGTIRGGTLISDSLVSTLSGGRLDSLDLVLGERLNASGGTLSNVTLSATGNRAGAGNIVVSNGGDLQVAGALVLDGSTVTLASDGSSTFLRGTSGAWSIGGNGTILFAGSHDAVRANNYLGYSSNSPLSIGAGVTVTGTNGGYIYFSDNGSNAGTILAASAGKEISLNAWNSGASWTNSGTLQLDGGGFHSGSNILNTGRIVGAGEISMSGRTLTNAGLLEVGRGLLLLTGNLTQTADGTLSMDIGGLDRGSGHGALDVDGTLAFGGRLLVRHVDGFEPDSSEAFPLIRYNVRASGSAFASLDTPTGYGYGSFYGVGTFLIARGDALDGQVNEWISNSSGDWATGTNWSLGVAPNGEAMTVLIDRIGYTPTVTVSSGNWTVAELISQEHLSITGGSLTVTNELEIAGNLTLSGSGQLTALTPVDLATVTLNGSSARFTVRGDGHIGSFLQYNGTSTFAGAGLAFDAIAISGGTVNYDAALLLPSSLLRVAGHTANLNADQGQTRIELVSGTLNLNLATLASDIALSGGTLNVAGSTDSSGRLEWTGGTIAGGGRLAVGGVLTVGGGNASFGLDNTVLAHANTSGDSRIAKTGGYFYLTGSEAQLINEAGAVLTVDTGGGSFGTYYTGGSGGTLNNQGTLIKSGSGTLSVYSPTRLQQDGVLDIREGSVALTGAGNEFNGRTTLAADTALQLSGSAAASAGETARFTGAGRIQQSAGTLTLAQGARIDTDYLLSNGNLVLAGSAALNGRFTWTGGSLRAADAANAGTLTVAGRFEQSGNNTVYLRDGLTLAHTNDSGDSRISNSSSSGFNIENGAIFRNTGTLTLESANAENILYIDQDSGSAGLFENTGTLIKTGAGRLDFGSYGNLAFSQIGSFDIRAGQVDLGGSNITLAQLGIAGDARVLVRAGTSSTLSGFTATGDGVLTLAGGTLVLGNASAIGSRLEMSSGTLRVDTGSSVSVDGDFGWTGGVITGGGTLQQRGVLSQTGSNPVYLRGGTVFDHRNASGDSRIAATIQRSLVLDEGSEFRNGGTLTFDVAGSGVQYIDQDSGAAGRFVNTGTLIKTGSGRLDFGASGQVALAQSGRLRVDAGRITLTGSQTEHQLGGQIEIADAGTMDITGGASRALAGVVVSGAGVLQISGGTLTLDDGVNLAGIVRQSGGSLAGNGSNELSGRYEWTGGNVTGSGTLTVSGVLQISGNGSFGLAGRSLRHTNASGGSALYKSSGYLMLSDGADFINADGALFYLDSGSGSGAGTWYSGTAGRFVNDGTLVKQGSGRFSFWQPTRLVNNGQFTVAQGSILADGFSANAGTLHLLNGTGFSTQNSALTNTGTISGFGTLTVGGTGLLNRGIVAPGGAGATGTLRIAGVFTQASDGSLLVERGASGTDALLVDRTAAIDGALVVSMLDGYTPVNGSTPFVSASAVSGQFRTQSLPDGFNVSSSTQQFILNYTGIQCAGICWDGGAGTLSWLDAANWTGDVLPGVNDLVFIALDGGVTVELSSGDHSIAALTTLAGNTLLLSGGTLRFTGGAQGLATSSLAGDVLLAGGTLIADTATTLQRLLLSAGTLAGSATITLTGNGSSWTGGSMTGSGRMVLDAGARLDYDGDDSSSSRFTEVRQGAVLRHLGGVLTLTGGSTVAGAVDYAAEATARYGGSASYHLDSTGQLGGAGRLEFIGNAVGTTASTAAVVAGADYTVRVQDNARFTVQSAAAIPHLEIAGSAQVVLQAGLLAGSIAQSGGSVTVNADSATNAFTWTGGTLTGPASLTLTGAGEWLRGTLTGHLRIAEAATLTLRTTGSDDVQSGSYKRFGAGSLTNLGTLDWQEGHVDIVGNARLDNAGRFAIAGNFSMGDRSVGTGTLTLNNLAGGLIRKDGGGETSIGTLGIPGGTANYALVSNAGRIEVGSGSLRFGIGYANAPGGGSFTHTGEIDIIAGATLEIGGSFSHAGHTFIDRGATLRRTGGFTVNAGSTMQGFGTLDVGSNGTLINQGTLQVGDTESGVHVTGTLTVSGHYVQGDDGQLVVTVGGNATGQSDRLAVSGSASLSGHLEVSESPGTATTNLQVDVVSAGEGVSGRFTSTRLPGADYSLRYTADAARVSFARVQCGGICWDGGAGTNLWTDAANWTGDVLPGVNDLVFIALDGGASVLLSSGDQRIAALNTATGSTLTIAGGTLTLTGGTNASLASSLQGDVLLTGGTLAVAGPASFAHLQQSGGFSQFDGVVTMDRLTLSGGENVTLRSHGEVTVTGEFDWRDRADIDGGGRFTTAGHTTATGGGGQGFGISVVWHNSGRIDLVDGALLHFYDTSDGDGGALINAATGILDISGGNALAVGSHSGSDSRFENFGTVIKNGANEQRMEGDYRFDNHGVVQVNAGRLDIRVSGGDGDSGVYAVASGATLAFGAGQRTLAAGSDVSGAGTVEFAGAQLVVNGGYGIAATGHTRVTDGRVDFAPALQFIQPLVLRGGIVNFNGATRLSRLDMGWTGGQYTSLGGLGTLTLTGSGSTVSDGVIASGLISGYDIAGGPLYALPPEGQRLLTVAEGADLSFGGAQYADLSGLHIVNDGTLTLVSNVHLNLANRITNHGTLNLGSDTTALADLADVAWTPTGTLTIDNTGDGLLVKRNDASTLLDADILNSGTLELVDGTLQLGGSFSQSAGGVLITHVDDDGAGLLRTAGSTTLSGALQVVEDSGYDRVPLDADIVTASGGVSGGFQTTTLPEGYTTASSTGSLKLRYQPVQCGGICWDGGAGTLSWLDAANWSSDVLPGLTDLVFIDFAGGAQVTLSSGSHQIAGLHIGAGNRLTLSDATLALGNADPTLNLASQPSVVGGDLVLGGGATLALVDGHQMNVFGRMDWNGAGRIEGGRLAIGEGGEFRIGGASGGHVLSDVRVQNGGSLTIETGGSAEVAQGLAAAAAAADGLQMLDGSLIDNSGVVTLVGDSSVEGSGTVLINRGLVIKTGSGGTRFADGALVDNTGAGTLDVREGLLALALSRGNAGRITLASGAALLHTGTLDSSGIIDGGGTLYGEVVNAGVLRPGGAAGIGTLTIEGSLTQTGAGRMEFDLAASSQDRIVVRDGGTLLDGVLAITRLGNVQPVQGESRELVSASDIAAGALVLQAASGDELGRSANVLVLLHPACVSNCGGEAPVEPAPVDPGTTPITVVPPLLPEVFKPPRIDPPTPPATPRVPTLNVADTVEAVGSIATAAGPQPDQPLRDFRASRLQCR
ncbi:two-partner secretion domain-containing protein [Methyloversatilis thermotolerans]|uniref:two-partner secretion domain-containing protein n=1 Tax=Methyloversatilis thermotolerans TaxID=1346290 RepID=UPI000363B194|nr:filamentous hemagglutinin N-terminal domain-containing protein [Methyloversatilis thermotolerans]